jgi:hypothetical protein
MCNHNLVELHLQSHQMNLSPCHDSTPIILITLIGQGDVLGYLTGHRYIRRSSSHRNEHVQKSSVLGQTFSIWLIRAAQPSTSPHPPLSSLRQLINNHLHNIKHAFSHHQLPLLDFTSGLYNYLWSFSAASLEWTKSVVSLQQLNGLLTTSD